MTTKTINTAEAKRFIHDLDNRIATAHHAELSYLVKELQEIRNEASVLLGLDTVAELDKLKEKISNEKV